MYRYLWGIPLKALAGYEQEVVEGGGGVSESADVWGKREGMYASTNMIQ